MAFEPVSSHKKAGNNDTKNKNTLGFEALSITPFRYHQAIL